MTGTDIYGILAVMKPDPSEVARVARQIRRSEHKAQGLCWCGNPPEPGRKSCQRCLNRPAVVQALRRGLCRCGGIPEVGRKSCKVCLDRSRAWAKTAKGKAKAAARYKSRITAGLCACGRDRDRDYTQCKACRARNKARSRTGVQEKRDKRQQELAARLETAKADRARLLKTCLGYPGWAQTTDGKAQWDMVQIEIAFLERKLR